jgi:hypothetical protein
MQCNPHRLLGTVLAPNNLAPPRRWGQGKVIEQLLALVALCLMQVLVRGNHILHSLISHLGARHVKGGFDLQANTPDCLGEACSPRIGQ